MTTRTIDNHLCRDGITNYNAALRCCGGTDGLAYKTVQGAIQASVAGDVLKVREGTYAEKATYWASPLRQSAFYVNKAVTIEAWPGETPALTYIPGDPPLVDTSDWGAIVNIAASATLRGLTIVGTRALGDLLIADTDIGVLVQNVSATLENCTIVEWGHCGVKTLNGAVSLQNCTITDGGFKTIDHCFYQSQPSYAGRTIISGCELARAAGYGVHLYGTPKQVNILGCNIHHNGNGGVLIGGPSCLVEDNQITDNTGYGGLVLWKATSAGGAYLRNTILNNTGSGNIVLDQAVGPNVIYQNTRHATIWTNTNLAAWPDDGTDVIV